MTKIDKTWNELRTRLNTYVCSKVDVDVSEDLVHDILLRVLQNEKELSKVDNPLAWIYTVARNRITDYYRKQAYINTISESDSLEEEIPDFDNQHDDVDHDFSKCLWPLLERLEPKYKEALLLTDFNEIKQAEAAEQVGISLSGMKSRVQRGRARLKEELLTCCAIEKDRFGNVTEYKQKDSSNKDQCC